MSDLKVKAPPDRGHPMPRRTTPETSVTLRHHRLARDHTIKAAPGDAAARLTPRLTGMPPRRNSSGESHQSDPKKWFDSSNRNPTATFHANTVDADPPFFQKETDSSNEDIRLEVPYGSSNYLYSSGHFKIPTLRPTATHSSSADDFRSVIDDLTIENKRLREELKRYRQSTPDAMRKEKLFEIKYHGLGRRKKRELEATLRDFAASLGGSSRATSQRVKSSKHANRIYSYGGAWKHASSSSFQSRPVDSAYASMSTCPTSSRTSLPGPATLSRARSSEQKVEHYLEETPEGLYPGFVTRDLENNDKKKLIVKKLEQLFTGRISARNLHRDQPMPSMDLDDGAIATAQPDLEASREAQIQLQSHDVSRKKNRSRDNLSTSNSNSNSDQTESGGNGNGSGSGSGNNTSRSTATLPEQRPTRPKDLDPDRIQIPSENMEYIRHLGLVPPELLVGSKYRAQDVSPDADGWVYLNLLCNLAQLHIFNASPNFIRIAICEKSTKFQLSPDGRKIRWRGGTEGTRFSGDSSGDNSQRSPSTDDDDGSDGNGQRKRQKMKADGDEAILAPSSKGIAKLVHQVSSSSESFHYKPMFVHQSSADTSLDDTVSQDSMVEDSNFGNTGNSRWDYSGSGSSPRRKKRRADGAVVFYGGAPFCTDLSGDRGDVSPATYMISTGRTQESSDAKERLRPASQRTTSGASLPPRPLTDRPTTQKREMDMEVEMASQPLTDDIEEMRELDGDFPWCDKLEAAYIKAIEPILECSGVGRVFPEDHFRVIVRTRRPRFHSKMIRGKARPTLRRLRSDETTDSIAVRLATLSASSPQPPRQVKDDRPKFEFEYVSGKIRRLKPVSLPPPATFYPPFSSSSESDDDGSLDSEEEDDRDEELLASSAEEVLSQKAAPNQSDNTYSDGEDLTSGDEEDEVESDHEEEVVAPSDKSSGKKARPSTLRSASSGVRGKNADVMRTGSSVATAGGAESGYSSSVEDD